MFRCVPHPLPRLLGASLLTGWLLAAAPAMRAHGDDQLLIDALTEELGKTADPDLLIRRGELFRHHQEWEKAEADFVAAGQLDSKLALVDFFRARVLLEAGSPAKALPFVARYVAASPNEAEGWFLRGEVSHALGKSTAGADDYAEGIRRSPRPRPEHYLRRARLLAAAPPRDLERVLAAVNEGIAKLGPVISLVDYAITLEVESGNYAAALQRVELALTHAPRRETWLVRRGDILVKAGRIPEAIVSYRSALSAIEELPERYRDTVPMEKLAGDARKSLQQLSSN